MSTYFSKKAIRKEELDRRFQETANRAGYDYHREKEDARRKEEDALREKEDARRKKEDARRKEEDACRKKEDARRKEEDARWKEEDARWKEDDARREEDRWNSVNICCATLPKRGKVKIYAKDRRVDSTPRLRIYSAEENENSDWRKVDHKGFSSAGGQGDGFSKPEVLYGMHPVDKELFQHGEALMATIDIENGDSSVKFHNWTEKFDLPFSTDCNSCIVVAFKGYSVRIVVE